MKVAVYILMIFLLIASVSAGFWTYLPPAELADKGRVTISGSVNEKEGGEAINDTYIEFKNPHTLENTRSEPDGTYSIEIYQDTAYEILVSKPRFKPHIEVDTFPSDDSGKDFVLENATSDCNADCTRGNVDICDRTCHGYNGCAFHPDSLYACDPWADPAKGFKSGAMVYKYGANDVVVECCTGSNREINTRKKTNVTSGDTENLILTDRIVMLRGNPVKIRVVVFN